MPPPIHIDDRGDLLVVTFRGEASDAQYMAHLDDMDSIYESKARESDRRWAVVIDATKWLNSTPNQRKMHAAWMQRHHDLVRDRIAGVAFAIESLLVRGGLTAVLWVAPMPCPYKITKTVEEAVFWARERLAEA